MNNRMFSNNNISIIKYPFLIIVILLIINQTFAQQVGFHLNKDHWKAEIPFQNLNNLVVIPVVINGKYPAKFILDSGVGNTLFTKKEIFNILQIPLERQISIPVIGDRKTITAYVASKVRLDMLGVTAYSQQIVVLDEDFLNLSNFLGDNVYGIIGYELFKHFVVKVNYIGRTITLIDPARFRTPKNYVAIPIEIENNRPYINVGIEQSDRSVLDARLMVDLGASYSMLLDVSTDGRIIIPEKHLPANIGRGLGGDITGFVGRINSCRIGKFNFNDVIVYISDNYVLPSSSGQIRNGTLGADILSRFQLIFDYRNNMLYLRRGQHYRSAFSYNMSGMEIVAQGYDLDEYVIVSVAPSSPAANADIHPGDKIITFNEKPADEIKLIDINHYLRSAPGSRVTIKIERKGEIIKKKFKLQKLI